jgi:hypothetical protein
VLALFVTILSSSELYSIIYVYSKFYLVYFSAFLVILNDNEKLPKKNLFKQSTISYSEFIFSLIKRTIWSSKLKGINCTFIATPPIKPCN